MIHALAACMLLGWFGFCGLNLFFPLKRAVIHPYIHLAMLMILMLSLHYITALRGIRKRFDVLMAFQYT